MRLQDWRADDRPREKLLRYGAKQLSDAELLAIFLRVGVAGKNAVWLAYELLAQFGSLAKVCRASWSELNTIRGMGTAKCAQLQAALELARRALADDLQQQPTLLNTPQLIRDYLQLSLGHLAHEVFSVTFLNAQHQLVASEILFHGTLTHTAIYPREILKRCLQHNAAAVIFAHNHPSGHTQPSVQDRRLTEQLQQALHWIEVRVLDHFVITQTCTLSLAEYGWLHPHTSSG